MIAIDENFRISETGGTGNATIFVNATDKNPFSTASTQIEVSSSVGNIKRYVTLNKKAAHGYMYTPVEWISNEDINSRIWIDLGYTWTNTSKAEIGMIIPTGNTANGTEIFGEWFDWTYRSNQYEPVDDATNDLRLFFDGSKCYWDLIGNNRTQLAYEKGKAIIWQFGNQYLNNVNQKTTDTGATVDIGTRTSTVGLFGAPASGGYTHKARFYYVKIWEGDTLVRDVIPVLDKDNIPCFLDKANATFYYYKVNGVPSTGLTAGNVIQELDYLQGDGTDYVDIGYVPNASTSIELDFEGDSGDLFGATNSGAGNGMFGYFGGGSWNWRYANKYGNFPQSTFSGRTVYKMTPSGDYVNNVQRSSWSGSWSNPSVSFYIFGIHRASVGLSGGVFNGKIYGVKIFEGDTLVREYIPAKIGSKKGFYDKVLGNFYPSNSNSLIDGNILGNLTFTVIYDEEDITINNDTPSTAINAGNTFNLNASTTPTGATLSYSSSDTSIATVDNNGVVTAVGKGTATITITAQGFQDNVNKVYYNTTSKAVSVECEERNGYSYTPVEYVSNEGLLDKHWVDLDYIWKDNSKVQLGFYSVYTNTKESWQVFGEDNQFDANGNVINDTDDVRLFLYNDSAYWDVTNRRVQRSSWSTSLYNNWHNVELGNNYVKDIDTGNQTTGSTYSISRTNTVGLFGSPKYALSNTDRIRYKYIKIYEGNTLVKDIIPVLDSNNIPCFFDKVNGTFHYYKVDGQPSTGLTAGNVYEELTYLQGDGSDYVVLDYIPNATTRIEVDCSGRPASTPSSGAGAGTVMGCEIWNKSQPYGAQGGISIGFPGAGGVSFHYGTLSYANKTSQKIIERGVFKLDGSAAYIDDFKVADVTTSFVTQGGPFALFNSLIYNSSNGTTFPISNIYSDAYYEGKIYGVKIYENNVLVRHYVPVKSSSKKGFYDKVLGNFYPSNSNTLVTGTVVGNLTINVTYSEDDVTISNNTPSGALTVGDLFSLGASTTPTGATLSYSSSDTSIATVGISGIITAVGTGTTTITITASDVFDNLNKVYYKGTSKTVNIECVYPTQQITITKDTPSEAIGIEGTFDLNVSTTPTGATVTYSSSDTSVATVSNQGIVTGVATGTTTITIVAEGFDDDVNHITYTSTSTTVSVTVADGVVETYDFMNGDGNDYIITDYAPNRNSVIEVKYENQGVSGNLIGFENRSRDERFRFEDDVFRITVYGNNSSVDTDSRGGVIKQNGKNVVFNGSVIGSTSYISNTDNLPLYIFSSNYNNWHEDYTYQGRIFYVKVWENNTLVHEWVGATKGGKVGVYDTVTSVFTASQYNDLTVGNEVLPEDSKYFLIKSTSSQQGIPPHVDFIKKGTPSGSLYYRKLNDTAWTEVTGNTNVELAGETGYVELKGSIHNDKDDQWNIEGSNIEPQGYLAAIARNEEITSSNNSIAGTYAKFYNLFNENSQMTNITNIIFPTDTDPACYEGMFINCTQITTAPILPATRLRSECYKEMFKNCFRLNTIPSAMLPSTNLTEDCYYGMFEGCSSITTGPNLPAPSTIQGCYYRMFYGCTSLTELRVFFTDTPATSYINYWLSNIWTVGTLYAPSNATYTSSDLQLPSDWTLLKTL